MSESTQNSATVESTPDQVVADQADLSMEGLQTPEELQASEQPEASEESGEQAAQEHTQKEVNSAAKKVNAKEVKGSDGELFKIKVDGKDIEVTKDEMVRLAQMGKAGQRAMQEKAQLHKDMAAFVKALRENPEDVLKEDLGLDVLEFAQKILAKQIEEDAKSPEQRRLEEMEQKLAQYEKERKEREERMEKEAFEAEVKRYEREIETQVMEAFNNWALPHTPLFLNRMADMMQGAYEKGLEVTPNQIAKVIKQDWIRETQDAYKSFSDKDLEEALGKDTLTRLRKNSIKKAKVAPSVKVAPTNASIKKEELQKPKEKINMRDWLRGIK